MALVTLSACLTLALGMVPAGCSGEDPASDGSRGGAAEATSEAEIALAEAESEALGRHIGDRYPARLATVLEKRFLRVLTSRNAFDFFIFEGRRGGYQYEKVRAFTRFLNERHLKGRGELPIQFELVPVDDDQLIPMLLEGAGDLVAARLTITPERAERVRFSRPYKTVDELVVTHDGTPPLESVEALSGRQVAVRESSSYAASLARLNQALGGKGAAPVDVVFVDEALETERILELVAARRFDYTVADSLVAELAIEIHPTLRIAPGVAIREDGQLAWATLPGAQALADDMNAFLGRYREGSLLGNMAARRYFEAEGKLARRLVEGEEREPGISDFDALFREQAAEFGLDWRLVAAMAYQESRFDPTAHNRWGAVGLMQIKPKTAREPYIDIHPVKGVANASNNVRAGLKYLFWIKRRYFDDEPGMRERDRLRMALAAYNAGPRSVLRARSRAKRQGLDPDRWFRNVELAMLAMRKPEPVKYVSEINQRYLSYVLLGVE
jgi:membrane-bound lytic murein transglycosylase MltF